MPASPTISFASTTNPLSQFNLPLPPPPPHHAHAVLTKADLQHSQAAYADLLASAKAYRVALAALGGAASSFGSALESCSRLKEARAPALGHDARGACSADALLTVGGLQHLVANHGQILGETVYRAFELPLLHELDRWRGAVEDEEAAYERAVRAQSRDIRRLEKEGLRLHRQQRRRDVGEFRRHLVELTTRLDALTARHGEHARTLLRESQDTSARILDASCSLARAEVDIFESLARKGWTGGGLEEVLEKGKDLFASEDQSDPTTTMGTRGPGNGMTSPHGTGMPAGAGEGGKLFSILPPRSILADNASDVTRPSHDRADSLLMDTERYQSLVGAAAGTMRAGDRDTDSVVSEFNRSRGVVRPFSPQPQPIRMSPHDVLAGLDATATFDQQEGEAGSKRRGKEENRDEEEEEEGHENLQPTDTEEEAHGWRNEKVSKDGQAGEQHTPTLDGHDQGRERAWSVDGT